MFNIVVIGYTITQLAEIIHSLFLGTMFNNYTIIGIVIIGLITIWVAKSRANIFGILLTGGVAMVFFLSTVMNPFIGGYLPDWLGFILVLILSILAIIPFIKIFGGK